MNPKPHRESGVNAEASWPEKRLKFAVSLRKARVDGALDDRPYIGLENVESWTGRLLLRAPHPDSDEVVSGESLCNSFEPGDVLFGKLRPYLAKATVADFAGRCTTEFLVMQPADLTAKFLFYICVSRDFVTDVDTSTFGSRMPRADWANIGNLKIPIPTLEQQTAITDYLDAEVSKVDSLVTAKEQWLELLAEKRQALITHAVTRGINPSAPLRDSGIPWLGQIPKHWRLVPLRFAVKFVSGATPDKGNADFWVGTIPWVSPKDMKRDEISDAEDHVSEEAILNSALRLVPVGSVLIVVRGMILAHSFPTAITTGPVTINQDMKALICYESLASRFLKAVFQGLSAWFVSSADQSAHGTKKLETETLGRFGIPLPPLDEQNAIVAHIAEETARLDALRVATEASIVLLKERRSALISAAVTGKLRVPAKSEVADSSATMV